MAAYRRVYDYACLSLWAWWEVVAARHRTMTMHAVTCMQSNCLKSGISSGPLRSITNGVPLPFYLTGEAITWRGEGGSWDDD